MSLPKSCNPSFLRAFGDYGFTPEFTKSSLRVFGDYEFTPEFTKSFLLVFGDYEFTKEFTTPAIILLWIRTPEPTELGELDSMYILADW